MPPRSKLTEHWEGLEPCHPMPRETPCYRYTSITAVNFFALSTGLEPAMPKHLIESQATLPIRLREHGAGRGSRTLLFWVEARCNQTDIRHLHGISEGNRTLASGLGNLSPILRQRHGARCRNRTCSSLPCHGSAVPSCSACMSWSTILAGLEPTTTPLSPRYETKGT
jgi:hypothetical protein